VPVQEERPSTCQHVHQRLSRCLRQRKSRQCSGLTRRQLPDGQRPESSRQSGRSVVTADTGRPKFAPFLRASRSSARNEAWPRSGATPERPGRRAAQSASGHLPKQLGGSTPAASTPHRGARFAFDAMRHRSANAGVDPASSARVARGYSTNIRQPTGNGVSGVAAARPASAVRPAPIRITALPAQSGR
jgi:hypothetical protein